MCCKKIISKSGQINIHFSAFAGDDSGWTRGPALSGCLRSLAQTDRFAGGSLVFFAGCRSRFEGENPFAPLVPRFFCV